MIVEMPEEIERVFSDYKMNLVQIRDSKQYVFQNEDIKDLFEISRSIYEKDFDQLKKNYSDRNPCLTSYSLSFGHTPPE